MNFLGRFSFCVMTAICTACFGCHNDGLTEIRVYTNLEKESSTVLSMKVDVKQGYRESSQGIISLVHDVVAKELKASGRDIDEDRIRQIVLRQDWRGERLSNVVKLVDISLTTTERREKRDGVE